MPICARCAGVCIGNIGSLILFKMFGGLSAWFCIAAAVPMAVDWSIQVWCAKESTNIRRLITGAIGGIGTMGIQLIFIHFCIGWFRSRFG